MEENNEGKNEEIIEVQDEVNNTSEEFEEVAYQEVEPKRKKKEVRTDSYFDGGVLDLIGWRLLGILISVVTLGIAIPWAQCMIYSYRFKHTVYNGKRLKFEGTGGDLFVQKFKWLFFTIITLGIYLFFVPVRKAKWVLSNLHYEDEEYVKEDSFFDGTTLGLIGINIASFLITFCSLGLLSSFAICLKLRWINNHSVINRKKLVFDGNGFQLIGKYLLWVLLTIVTFGIFGLWLPIRAWKWETKHTHIKKVGEEVKKDKTILFIIPILILMAIGIAFLLKNVKFDFEFENPKEIFTKITGKDNASLSKAVESDFYDDEDYYYEEEETYTPPAKTSITVGGYTLPFGTYKGQIVQGVWDDETMTSTARYTDIVLKLTEDTITVNGDSGSYYVSGGSIIWKGESYYFEVNGNNTITYMAENCPDLIYQGY